MRAGGPDGAFLKIWVVKCQAVVRARSWALARRSWYTAFLDSQKSNLQSGGHCIAVRGNVPKIFDLIADAVDEPSALRSTTRATTPCTHGHRGPGTCGPHAGVRAGFAASVTDHGHHNGTTILGLA